MILFYTLRQAQGDRLLLYIFPYSITNTTSFLFSHFFIICYDAIVIGQERIVIKIIGNCCVSPSLLRKHLHREIKQFSVVRLQSEYAVWLQNIFVHFQETRMCQSSFGVAFSRSWIGMHNPYFTHFVSHKKLFQVMDNRTQKSHICQL